MINPTKILYWRQNKEWWELDENDEFRLTEKAPEEARQSFQLFLEKKRYDEEHDTHVI